MTVSLRFRPQQSVPHPDAQRYPFTMRIVARPDNASEIFALRYRAYRDMDYIGESQDRSFADSHDLLPTTAQIAAYDAGKCVGALRLSVSPLWNGVETLPAAAYYPEIDALKAEANGTLIEVGRAAIEPSLSNTSYRTTLYASLVRAGLIAARAVDAAVLLIATRAEWRRFYATMLGMKQVGSAAPYPPGNFPIVLMAGRMADALAKQKAQNSFFSVSADEVASMREALKPLLALRPD